MEVLISTKVHGKRENNRFFKLIEQDLDSLVQREGGSKLNSTAIFNPDKSIRRHISYRVVERAKAKYIARVAKQKMKSEGFAIVLIKAITVY